MAGVNLSQSMEERAEKSKKRLFSSSGFPISIILLLLTLAGWGGLRFYLSMLDQKIIRLDADIAENSGRLQGASVDRVADFNNRLTLLGADPAERIDPKNLLTKIEALIVPQVVLTKYEYSEHDQKSILSGETESFRSLAEQIISLKSDPSFSQVTVDDIDRTDDGKIAFSLSANFLK